MSDAGRQRTEECDAPAQISLAAAENGRWWSIPNWNPNKARPGKRPRTVVLCLRASEIRFLIGPTVAAATRVLHMLSTAQLMSDVMHGQRLCLRLFMGYCSRYKSYWLETITRTSAVSGGVRTPSDCYANRILAGLFALSGRKVDAGFTDSERFLGEGWRAEKAFWLKPTYKSFWLSLSTSTFLLFSSSYVHAPTHHIELIK